MAKIKSDRLRILARHLKKIDTSRFDMECWVFNGDNFQSQPNTCGTVACAFGHATVIPEFQKLGLKMHSNVPRLETKTGHVDAYNAAAKFFGLSRKRAEYLFCAHEYHKKGPYSSEKIPIGRVIRRIEEMARLGEAVNG